MLDNREKMNYTVFSGRDATGLWKAREMASKKAPTCVCGRSACQRTSTARDTSRSFFVTQKEKIWKRNK